jgi:hypothetical protein
MSTVIVHTVDRSCAAAGATPGGEETAGVDKERVLK